MRHRQIVASNNELTGQVISLDAFIRLIDELQSTESKNLRHLIPYTRVSMLVGTGQPDTRSRWRE
jgi:hypothetical protein